ncbi:MAG: polysaccharide deacetylase family protein [Verrucomicrobiota bacterium]
MLTKSALIPLLLALALPNCKKHDKVQRVGEGATPTPSAATSTSAAAAAASASPTAAGPKKIAIDQTAEVIIYGYHRFVSQVKRPDTEITPQAFEQQMQELKDRGIPVIPMQDLLAWKRGEKNIPPRSAVITFDDGWKSQYEVAWPILKKFNYPLTLFIYTEGVRGGNFGGGEAMTWEQLAEMRDAGVDIQGHSATHQDLKKPYDKVSKKRLNPQEYQQWLEAEIRGSKQLLEQRLGIRVNCFAVPYGLWNQQVKETAMRSGFDAMFTVYGQPITFRTPNDSIGRYLIEGNKPKVFADAIGMIATSAGGGAPVSEIGPSNISAKPGDGETVRSVTPLISANLSPFGTIDAGSVIMRVSGLGLVPVTFDPKTSIVSYQVAQKLRDKVTVIVEAKSGSKKVAARWTFAVEEGGAAAPGASQSPAPKK